MATDLDDQLGTALRERGQRVTAQRVVIHRVLQELDAHVTAEAVLEAVADRLPGVSLPTVYATLDLPDELGMARRVAVPGGPAPYRPRPAPPPPPVCARGGRVEAAAARVDRTAAGGPAAGRGSQPRHAEVLVTGL